MASRDLDNRKKLAVAKLELYAKALEDLRYAKRDRGLALQASCAAILTFTHLLHYLVGHEASLNNTAALKRVLML
jgi:hypothetical protein